MSQNISTGLFISAHCESFRVVLMLGGYCVIPLCDFGTCQRNCEGQLRKAGPFQRNKTLPMKYERKRNVSSCFIKCWMAFKFYQTTPTKVAKP